MTTITKRNKWSYCVGCIGRDMMFILVSMFILAYIQYTMKLSVAQFAAISAIMIFARVWDAINDPMMGMLIENTRLKGGKFRPWIMIGGFLNFLVTLILFTFRPGGWLFIVFFGIFYLAWGMTFTINDISYWSLLPNLSKNNDERNALTNLLLVFASIGQFLAGGLIPVLVTGNAVTMYKVIGIGISFIFLGFTMLTYFGVREKVDTTPKKEKVTVKQMVSILFNNDQLFVVTIGLLFYTIAIELFIALALNFFYFEFGYGGKQLTMFTVFFGLGTLSALGVLPLINKRFNRMAIMGFATIILSIGYIIFLLLGYVIPMNEVVLYIAVFLAFFGTSMFYAILVVMTANTIEYNELRTGYRNESIVFSVRPFMTKLGAAIQQGVVTLVLLLSGIYGLSQEIADLEIQKGQGLIEDVTLRATEITTHATPSMLLVLRLGMGLCPLILMVLAYTVIKKKYTISEEKYNDILNELEKS